MSEHEVLAYRIDDACRAIGIGKTRLYELMGEGHIEARICGGRTLVLADSLRKFVERLPRAEIRTVRKPRHRPAGKSNKKVKQKRGPSDFSS